ncbi:MAG: methylated-DNA--[protein]-cysteine S-methyltransferase [Alphaproteobacteria bacterium]|jgi:methylated-DNA-[protein]-cysteine S-methyltransferase
MKRFRTSITSPIGDVWMVIADGALELLDFADDDSTRLDAFMARHYPEGLPPESQDDTEISAKVAAYFSGDLTALEKISVNPRGTTFQQGVWQTLREIPCGQTIAYKELASRAGRPKAVRAAGAANGQNPVSLVVPCHRVIGSDGSLTGYGGGLFRKKWLLQHEGALCK